MDVILLAAGYSSRTNTYKMALEIKGQSILSHLIQTFSPFCENIIVVGGHYYDATKDLLQEYPHVILVNNDQYDLGMFSSIQRGVLEVENDFFIIPGDCPLVLKETCEEMCKQFPISKQNGYDILIPTYNGKRGHPILLSKALKDPLLKEGIESNLRSFKAGYAVDYLEVRDEGILLDLDTMEDYQNLIKIKEARCHF